MAQPKYTEKDFYNKPQKMRFLKAVEDGNGMQYGESSKVTIVITAKRIFTQSKLIEELEKKDIADFSRDKILDFYSYLSTGNFRTLANINNVLMMYVSYIHPNHDKELYIRTQDLQERINKNATKEKIISREELVDSINRVKTYKPELFIACRAFLLLAIFEGIGSYDMKEVFGLKKSDLYKEKDKYFAKLITGRKLEISKELYDISMLASEELGYNTLFKNGMRRYNYLPSPFIYRVRDMGRAILSDEEKLKNNIIKQSHYMKRALELFELPQMTVKDLLTSGLIDNLKKEFESIGVDIKELIDIRYTDYKPEEREVYERVINRYTSIDSSIQKAKFNLSQMF